MKSVHLAALALLLPVAAASAMPADQAQVDRGVLDACIEKAGTDGALACVGTGHEACVADVRDAYKDVGPVDGEMACFGAERDYWDGRLTAAYDRLMTVETGRGAERAEALKTAERAWIAFRDALCAYDKATNGHGTGGEMAEQSCLVRETARQSLVIDGYLADRN